MKKRFLAALSSLLLITLMIMALPVSGRAAGNDFVTTYFPNGISKPDAPYMDYQMDNDNWDELYMYVYTPNEIINLDRSREINYEKEGIDFPWRYEVFVQYDFRIDDGSWHYNAADWDLIGYDMISGYESIDHRYIDKGCGMNFLQNAQNTVKVIEFDHVEGEDLSKAQSFFSNALITFSNDDRESNLRLNLADHKFEFRYRYVVSYDSNADWYVDKNVTSDWSNAVSIGKNGSQTDLVCPSSFSAPQISNLEFESDVNDGSIGFTFNLVVPNEVYQLEQYYSVVENTSAWCTIFPYYRVYKNGKYSSWTEFVVANAGWLDSGSRSGNIYAGDLGITTDDRLEFMLRIKTTNSEITQLTSPRSNVLKVNAPWIEADHTGHNVEYLVNDGYHRLYCHDCEVKSAKQDHDMRWIIDDYPSETETGIQHEECSVCQYKRNTNTEVPVLEHDPQYYPEVEATCNTNGCKEYWYCENCRKYCKEDGTAISGKPPLYTIPSKNHNVELVEEESSTCLDMGHARYYHCTEDERCFTDPECRVEVSPDDLLLPPAPHKYTVEDPVPSKLYKAATCTSSAKYYLSCEVCGESSEDEDFCFTYGDRTPHTYKTIVSQAASITAAGYTDQRCTVCQWINPDLRSAIPYPKTFTLEYTTKAYAGAALTPAITVMDSAGKTVSSKYYTVSYSNNNAVGTAKVVLTFKGKYEGKTSVKFTITPGKTTVKLGDKTAVYTGKAISAAKAAVTGSTGTVYYVYFTDSACKTKTTAASSGSSSTGKAPVYGGTYYVKAVAPADANYEKGTSKAAELVINPAEQEISAGVTSKTLYASKLKTEAKTFSISPKVKGGASFTCKKASGSSCLTISTDGKITVKKGTKAGTYTIKVKISASANRNCLAGSKYITIKVIVK